MKEPKPTNLIKPKPTNLIKPEKKTQLPKKTKPQEVSADRVKDPRGRKEKKVQQYEAESLRKFKEWQR